MPTLNLPNVRIDSDMRLNVSLTDNNVAVNWTSLTGIHAYAYSDAQRIMAGELEASVDPTDSTKLIVNYRATVPQYLGICRLVVRGTYQNRQKTYDKQVANFVETTAAATGVTVVTDPVVNVQLSVNEVSTSILDEAIDACIAATANATSAATAANTAAAKFNAAVVQTTGQATDKVMSQKAVTDAINAGGGSADAVKYTPQTLTTPQKAQARMNIGAGEGSYDKPATGIPATDLASAVQTSLGKADTALQEHQSLAAYRTSADQDVIDATKGTYSKPAGGIPSSDLTSAVQTSLGKADTALQEHQSLAAYRTSAAQDVIDATKGTYSKPADGIPATDLTTAAQASLGKADTALQKGNNTLTANHILVTDSAGNVADSGKTTADLQDVIYGYMNNSTFYLTRTGSAGSYVYSDAVTPEQNKQYTDKEGNVPYVWDGAEYHAIGGSSGVPEAPIDGKPYYRKNGAWADASVGETETVYIHFSSSDSQLTLLGLQASISFADGSATRLLTADASGNCSTMIDVGKVYTITVADQTGYQHIASKTLKASLAERNVYFNYEKNISGGDCTITVTLTCSGGRVGEAPSWEGTSVNLSLSNNTARTATVVGGVATFTNVTRGLSGKVSCTKLSGWITPTIANVDTTLQTIGVTMNYARVSATGIFMVASTGEEYTYQTWDTSLTCVAIHIATSALSEAGADYYVRINDLNANNLTGKAWQTNLASNWRALPNVHYYNASTPYYDGETDTAMMISDCADIEETSPAAQWAIQQSFTHLGVPHAGFIPTRDQFQPMFDNKDYIYNCYNLATGNTANYYTSQLWSASQFNSNYAWCWGGGSWYYSLSKGSTYRVLSVFAI